MKEDIKESMKDRQVSKDELTLVGFMIDRLSHPEKPYSAGEIVEYRGKNYKLVAAAESIESLEQYSMVYSMLESQNINWFIADDFTSEKHTSPVAAIFVELSKQNIVDMVHDYRAAVAKIATMKK